MKKNLKTSYNDTKGITLVSLVVTIIVLLILAGVSISLIFNSEGLFSKANEAGSRYNESKNEEADYLKSVMNDIEKYNGIYLGESTPNTQPSTEIQKDTTKHIASDGEWCIPKGFKEAEDSGKTIKDGKVIEDAIGNQWVWIPCYVEGGIVRGVLSATPYQRTDFRKQEGGTYLDFSETLDLKDLASIKKYGGFYIGRYEAGAETEVSSEDTKRKVLIQKDKKPYNWIAHENCVAKSNSFANDNNYDTNKVYTKLVSSYAWDTALNFIGKSYPAYATNSPQGIYGQTTYKNTGLSTAVCNIYDMGGNLWERTSETRLSGYTYVVRGGRFCNSAAGDSAGYRNSNNGVGSDDGTFRCTLYLL